ncbi:hypothetical protein V7S43_007233 [Phytophthora oleae]|uniref:Uncharacterized protein n=1 Tax=Phytophthora oleae TaxID=2107226 RepID=A0ABD3FL99_9STRA
MASASNGLLHNAVDAAQQTNIRRTEQSCIEHRVTEIRQLKAIARRDRMKPQTVDQSKLMEDCIDSFLLMQDDPEQEMVSRMQFQENRL